MAENRSFSDDNIPTKADDYHGFAEYVRTQPNVAAQGVKSINVELSFEEALRLSLAIQSCVLSLNRYKRSTTMGREMGLCLSIKTDGTTITVIEKRVRPATEQETEAGAAADGGSM
jgi:hypothetical protein